MKHLNMRLAILTVATLAALSLTSCATINSPDAQKQQQARIVVEGATVALIERSGSMAAAKADKAKHVLEYTAKAKS